MQPKELILKTAADLGLSMTAEFVPFSQSRNKDETRPSLYYWGETPPSLNWRVTLWRVRGAAEKTAILTTDYSAGCAHAPSYKQGDRSVGQARLVAWECEYGRKAGTSFAGSILGRGPMLQPDFAAVLYSLMAADSSVLDSGTFEDWASDFGCDPDSRSAEKIYRACLEIALKLRNGIGEEGLALLRAACQDY